MRNYATITSIFLFFFVFISSFSNAQTFTGNDAEAIIHGASKVQIDDRRNTVSFITLNESVSIPESNHLLWLTNALKAGGSASFTLDKKERDEIGYTHYRYDQQFHGLKVEYGRYYVHVFNGIVKSANGEYYDNITVSTQPSVTKESALEKALSYYNSNHLKGDRNSMLRDCELLVLPYKNKYFSAWKFDVYSLEPLKRSFIYVDAMTGNVITDVNRIHTGDAHATAITAYNGNVTMTTDSTAPTNFRLRAAKGFNGLRTLNLHTGTTFSSATDFIDSDNAWTVTGTDRYANDAHYAAEATYDWYLSRFSRNSFDNAGATIFCYVHYSTGYVNAFWDGTEFVFGDGDSFDYTALTSTEIVGHEITHAVTEHTAGLVYNSESGALNEGYSDCMGVAVDYYKNPTTANFLQGDQISLTGVPFRNMSDPNQLSNPDTYHGLFWDPFEEVHCNSGVMNFWFYLLSMGGSGTNDNGNSYTINAITITKASAIAYRALTVYLTPNSNYSEMRGACIQSAIDLYSNCSNEVIQVTNAWYAVGVGGIFSNAVIAGFSAAQNYFCVVPATVNFTNTSMNATSYFWTFGDGTTSTSANPSHPYAVAGTYTVTLIANGAASCSSGDTIQMVNYITVTNGGGPISAACTPHTTSFCCGIGITNFSFGTISHPSLNASEGYKDNTCGNATTVTAGDPVAITVATGLSNSENVKTWIDYNNDGTFNTTTEQVFVSNNHTASHTGIVHTSASAVLNTPVRIRVTDDNSTTTINGSCHNSMNGQTEDYTVTFIANTQKPAADFVADIITVNVGGTVNFSDLSVHVPTSWQWTFTSGLPATSTGQNPSVIYNTLGTFNVKLKVTNSFGADSIIKTAYIHVVNSVSLCTGITSTTATNGQFYDSGGPSGSYQNNENCSLLVDPGCATSITLTFSQFATEACCDFMRIYNGNNASAPLIATLYGTSLPSPVTASSGKMFIVWTADGSGIYTGWSATWASVIGTTTPPVAAFSTSTSNPPLAVDVQFTDHTTNMPNAWSWTFGDGNVSTMQNPLHAYASPGVYNVTLLATNCVSSDTIIHTVTVQTAPNLSINPDTINQTLDCSDSIVVQLTVTNTGTGDGVIDITHTASSDSVRILAFMTGVDAFQEFQRTLDAINTYFTRYSVTQTLTTSSTILDALLDDADVLLFPEQETGSGTFYASLATVVQDFVNGGGRVIVLGASGTSYERRMYDMGLFTGTYQGFATGTMIQITDTTDELTNNCPLSFSAPDATFYHDITNADKVELASYNSYDICTYRNIGTGKAIYIGFDYYDTNPTASQLIANAVSTTSSLASWIHFTQLTDTIPGTSSQTITVRLNSTGLSAGNYQQLVAVQTNDPLHPVINLLFNLTVVGPAEIALSDTCIAFGTITQHTTRTDTVDVYNNGCDTLDITSITSSNPAFTASTSTMHVAPGAVGKLIVTFHPVTVGTFNGTLTLLNNSNDTTICLSGAAGAAPAIVISPNVLSANLNPCSDSITVPFWIINTGGSDLEFNVDGFGSGGDSLALLAYVFNSDLLQEYANTLNGIEHYFTNFTLDTSMTTSASYLASQLVDKDVLLFVEQEGGSTTHYASFAPVVQDFVTQGGTVVMCGMYTGSTDPRPYDLGLFSGTSQNYVNSGTGNVSDTTDDIMDGVPLTINLTNSTFYHNFTNADKTELLSYTGFDIVTYRPIGNGRAIYVGFDFYETNANTERIISNSIRYADNHRLPDWIDLSSTSGTVTPGDSTLIYVTLSSGSLSGGTYTAYIRVLSNDPLHPIDSLPVTITIGNTLCARIGTNAISTCSGIVNFRDSSLNTPTSWSWNFGDGGSSVLQNPTHTYAAAGTYLVKLNVCNGFGCDSTTRNITIVSVNGPVSSICPSPATTSYCCSAGITHVTFNSISNTSLDGIAGYEDFTCSDSTTVTQGLSYTLTINTGPSYSENTIAWIDYNGDGAFTLSERVMNSLSTYQVHTAYVTIPNLTQINTPLRMRVSSDISNYPAPGSCDNLTSGQSEDYTIFIRPNTLPPDANLNYTLTSSCSGEVHFTDLTNNNPSSWLWTFGDGQSSTLQNPVHTYTASGSYVVKLRATNIYGTDSTQTNVYINVISNGISVTGNMIVHQDIHFSTSTTGSVTYLWDFGDGYLASLSSPVHQYSLPGVYIVRLTVTSGICTATLYDTLNIQSVDIDELSSISSFTVFPNPFTDEVKISYTLTGVRVISLQVFDQLGRLVNPIISGEQQTAGDHNYTLKDLSSSMYFVRFTVDDRSVVFKLVKE